MFVFGNLNTILSSINHELETSEIFSESKQLCSMEINRFQMIKIEELKLQKQLHSLWAPKARVMWQLVCEKNMKFFQSNASSHL